MGLSLAINSCTSIKVVGKQINFRACGKQTVSSMAIDIVYVGTWIGNVPVNYYRANVYSIYGMAK